MTGRDVVLPGLAGRRLVLGSGADGTVWDDDRQVWLARRDGEPAFVWVRGYTDAYLAACVHRGVDLIVPAAIYREWVAAWDAPEVPAPGVALSP